MSKPKKRKTILSIFPNTVGICYAVFFGNELVDYAIGYIRPVNNKKAIDRVTKYLDYYKPDVVIIRELSKPTAVLNRRNNKLIKSIIELINNKQKIELQTYSRNKIQEIFSLFDVYSRFQIMKKLIYWFPQLEVFEYPYRKDFMGEHSNTGLFTAVSQAVTYFYEHEYYYGDKS